MTSPTPPNLLATFSQQLNEHLVSLPLRMPARTRDVVARESKGLCVFCSEKGMTLARLVPHNAGGPSRMPNLIFSCRACHRRRNQGDLDALELEQTGGLTLPPALIAQRYEALATCPQHPVPPAARRSLDDCRAYLTETRWSYPRVSFLLAQAGARMLLAALQVPLGEAGGSLVELVREAGGRSEGNGVWSIGIDTWPDVAWQLIERHAILNACDLNRASTGVVQHVVLPGGPWRERWGQLFDDMAGARRDAQRKPHHGFKRGSRSRAWTAGQSRRAS